jgi:hypothetical protein
MPVSSEFKAKTGEAAFGLREIEALAEAMHIAGSRCQSPERRPTLTP